MLCHASAFKHAAAVRHAGARPPLLFKSGTIRKRTPTKAGATFMK
jgi:hypothetical protein